MIREAFEETGVKFKIDRLGFIHENFFRLKETNEFFHELSFYYYLEVNDDFELVCQSINEYGDEEFLEWLPIDKLSEYIIYPEFFREKLESSFNKITHIITRGIE